MNNQLTQERLRELLHYNPETGIFTRLVQTTYSVQVGDVAGSINDGYRVIMVDGINYRAHRLAWLYIYGCFPNYGIDHRDRARHHNWIENLREATQQCNIRNTGNRKNNTSGCKGVWYDRCTWRAKVKVNGKTKGLGSHSDFDEAVCHRLAAEQCLDWSNCDSNSPAFQHVKTNIQKNI